jgi:cyanophycin synthetase
VVLAEGEREETLVSLDHVPLTRGGLIGFHVENALAAIAAAWALGISRDVLRARLESFTLDLDKVPGRFNILEIDGATVVVDYGHNPSALLAVIETIGKMPHTFRRVVYSTAGDRRDCDMIRQGQLLGEAFDHVILYEDHYQRGRADGEIIGLFKQGIGSRSRARQIEEIHGAVKAVEAALKAAQPGDLLVVQADAIDETVNFIRRYLSAKAAEAEQVSPLVDALAEAVPEEVLAAGAHAGPQEAPSAEVGSNISA